MIKVSILYGHPRDPAAFEKYYAEVHLREHAPKIPNVLRIDLGKAVSLDGSQPARYRVTDLWFRDAAALGESLRAPGTQAAIADIGNFATGGFEMVVSDVQTIEG